MSPFPFIPTLSIRVFSAPSTQLHPFHRTSVLLRSQYPFISISFPHPFGSPSSSNVSLPKSQSPSISLPLITPFYFLSSSLLSFSVPPHCSQTQLHQPTSSCYTFTSIPTIRSQPSVPCHTFGLDLNLPTPQFPFTGIHTSRVLSRSSSSEAETLTSDRCDDDSSSLTTDADKMYKSIMDNCNYADLRMEAALVLVGVKLTPELVDEMLQRLRYEEKAAFRFFRWAGHQEGYAHQPKAYTDMIDILSSTKYKAKQFGIVCDILDYMKRTNKDSVPIENLLTILRKYTEKHLTHLQKFTKKKRIRVKTQPEINAFNLLVDSLCKCSLVEEADAMFIKVKNKLTPDANTYNILFFGWCRVRNPIRGMKVLEEMIEMGHTPENFTYNAAIETFCRAGMVSEASELFEFMRTKGSTMSSPTAKTYSIMIVALAKFNQMDECYRLLADMRNSGCLPDVSTYKELIEGMCLAGKVEEAYKFLEEMGNKGYPPDIVTYNCFLKVLCNLKRSNEALRLFGRMVEVGCEPSVQTYNMLITMFFEMGVPDGAFDSWNEMDKRGCLRDTDTYCVMIEGLFGNDRAEDACLLLEDVMNNGLKLPYQKFDNFLMQLSKMGNLHAIHQLSEHMRRFYNPAMARRFSISQKRKSMSLRRK